MFGLKLSAQDLVFWVVAATMVVTALGVVLNRNPLRSALMLVLNFVGLAAIYFLLNAQVLGVLQILVYAGAIMVLFIFVIMMLNLGGERTAEDPLVGQRFVASVLGLALLSGLGVAVYWFMFKGQSPGQLGGARPLPIDVDQSQVLGISLFTKYLYPFELTSILLLIGLIGAVVLAKQHLTPDEASASEQEAA